MKRTISLWNASAEIRTVIAICYCRCITQCAVILRTFLHTYKCKEDLSTLLQAANQNIPEQVHKVMSFAWCLYLVVVFARILKAVCCLSSRNPVLCLWSAWTHQSMSDSINQLHILVDTGLQKGNTFQYLIISVLN